MILHPRGKSAPCSPKPPEPPAIPPPATCAALVIGWCANSGSWNGYAPALCQFFAGCIELLADRSQVVQQLMVIGDKAAYLDSSFLKGTRQNLD